MYLNGYAITLLRRKSSHLATYAWLIISQVRKNVPKIWSIYSNLYFSDEICQKPSRMLLPLIGWFKLPKILISWLMGIFLLRRHFKVIKDMSNLPCRVQFYLTMLFHSLRFLLHLLSSISISPSFLQLSINFLAIFHNFSSLSLQPTWISHSLFLKTPKTILVTKLQYNDDYGVKVTVKT